MYIPSIHSHCVDVLYIRKFVYRSICNSLQHSQFNWIKKNTCTQLHSSKPYESPLQFAVNLSLSLTMNCVLRLFNSSIPTICKRTHTDTQPTNGLTLHLNCNWDCDWMILFAELKRFDDAKYFINSLFRFWCLYK